MADGSATPARVTRRGGWTRESEGMWRREVGALRLVVYYRRSFGWRWSVRGAEVDTFDYAATARDAKAVALEFAQRLTAEVPRG